MLAVRHTTRSWRGIQIVISLYYDSENWYRHPKKAFHHIYCDCNHVGIMMVVILWLAILADSETPVLVEVLANTLAVSVS